MRTVRLPLLRGALFIIALAAMAFIMARGDNPAQATSYNPISTVSVSDPTPGANADLTVNFSLNLPDAFPNLTTDSSIQFLPRAWGINVPETDEEKLARVGGIAGTFNVLTEVGIVGSEPCTGTAVIDFTMYDANVDTSRRTSALDVADSHPGGLGYSGQFMPDLDTAQGPPSDFGTPLVPFVTLGNNHVGNEFYNGTGAMYDPRWALFEAIYRDNDGSGTTDVDGSGVTVGDTRLTGYSGGSGPNGDRYYPAGSVVAAGDFEFIGPDWNRRFNPVLAYEKHADPNGNGLMDPGEAVYDDYDNSGAVSYNDVRQFTFEGQFPPTSVAPQSYLLGGVSRYPDFLAQMFPPDVVGEPLARMWGAQTVAGTAVVSLNLVTFRPGQLPGFPATMGYPIVTVVLDPVASPEMAQLNMTNVTCTPLSLVSTNFGVSHDNPETPLTDEGGYVRLTNPKAEKDHTFTLVTTSDYDADDDGIENWLDSCDLTPDTPAGVNGRTLFGGQGDTEYDPNWNVITGDGLNEACDPDPNSFIRNQGAAGGVFDQDLDGYANVADNCPLTPNGYSWSTNEYKYSPPYNFFWAVGHDPVGPDNQADTDQDRIGDACEGAEAGPQCANDVDDDGDGVINDGCPRGGDTWAESGDQCTNAVDDDGDGLVNDGCPKVVGVAESGAQCANAVDDDGDGWVNEGCPRTVGSSESGDQCANAADDDGDGLINDGCPSAQGYPESGGQCTNAVDDDGDGLVNDGCPNAIGSPETGDQCANAIDDDGDGLINDGCPAVGSGWAPYERSWQCNDALDQDGDGYVNDGCAVNGANAERYWRGECSDAVDSDTDGVVNDGCPVNGQGSETGAQCANDIDDDGDGLVNDGCPGNGANAESGIQCSNSTDDDGDGFINDGCPAGAGPEWGAQCDNAIDDDADGVVNDGCRQVFKLGTPETACDGAVDDDVDGLVNDGCPAVDPGDVAKTTRTGHKHVVTVTNNVTIFKHGVKLDDLDGKESVAAGGSANYKVSLENKGGSAEDFPVALRVVEGCGTVSGPSTVHVNGDASANADFTVDFSTCAAGEYTVQADACHAGDPAPTGLFGAGACPGTSDVPQPPSGPLSLSSATASSEDFGAFYAAAKAIDGLTETLWCTGFAPGVNIQASFASPVSVDRVDIEDSFGAWGYAFVTGTLWFSNGYSQDVTLTAGAGSFSVPLQSGVEWVKFTATAGGWAGCISELKAFGFIPPVGDTNLLDDAPMAMSVEVGP